MALRDDRIARDLTMKQVANEAGISESFYCLIESGDRRPSVETAKKIAAVLGFDWTRFYEGGEEHGTD